MRIRYSSEQGWWWQKGCLSTSAKYIFGSSSSSNFFFFVTRKIFDPIGWPPGHAVYWATQGHLYKRSYIVDVLVLPNKVKQMYKISIYKTVLNIPILGCMDQGKVSVSCSGGHKIESRTTPSGLFIVQLYVYTDAEHLFTCMINLIWNFHLHCFAGIS